MLDKSTVAAMAFSLATLLAPASVPARTLDAVRKEGTPVLPGLSFE